MATTQHEIGTYRVLRGACERVAVPVILDEGRRARVAAVALPCDPSVGVRFEFGGAIWEIARAKDHARGWVAHPAAERRAAS